MSIVDALQRISYEWGVRCFGEQHMTNLSVRSLRFAEEAVELCQCAGVDEKTLHLVIKTVYERPTGSPKQEVGGCLVTLSVLCHLLNYRIEECFETEVRRVLAKSPEHFAKRNLEKIHLGLNT